MRFLRAAAATAISGSLIFAGGAPARAADGGPTIVDSGLPSGLVGAKPVITATVSDDLAVVRVELMSSRVRLAEAAGANLTTVTLRPDLTVLRGPMVDLELVAYDADGNSTRATSSVFVDAEFPAATLSPATGASLSGVATITLSGVSADTVLATLVERDSRLVLSQATAAPWTLTWNTVGSADFPQVRLVDQAGNVTIYQPVWHADNELPVIGALSWKRSGGPAAPSGRAGG
ncbi:hypothetical protein AB0C07_20545 [Actinoplanes missouriensis]|uniref:hypothetical protein n=1 Tax=Actinoplanes missouriensis TaxID=1866 RepID=UPI0033EE7EB5